ncbi:terpenoid synthase [Aaosphaeria arxii CBS 175.79]|uniref:Terpene synthase n=1 Tax=Aaosphaeria arxii CBS 175.79 TaxID=1450172 RepID=A0A6A5X7R2_9PLEO|nr:terpenoid synthase [Aaosphaeria arxii CBS 175.79]KAF2008972.1 terpenoid synthase [Aaosphaeria arxii CBS 175.79]
MKASNAHDTRSEAIRDTLLLSLKGQMIRIPNLKPLFRHWPTQTSPHVDRLRGDVKDWLNDILPPSKILKALQASDFGLFGATWWPFADFEQLKIVTFFAIWLFIWDDEIDHSDGAMWDDHHAAQLYREETLAYIRFSLGLSNLDPEPSNEIILTFDTIGSAVRKAYSPEKCHMFYEELRFYIENTKQEEAFRIAGAIPTIEEYWRYRLGSSAVYSCLALNEFSWSGMDLPVEFYSDEDVRTMFRYTNVLVVAVNDLLSVKKEIKRNAIDSLIPILVSQFGDSSAGSCGDDIQIAVDEVVTIIDESIKNMDHVAESLTSKYEHADEETRVQVRRFVDGCKAYTTGNLTWSLETDRYGVKNSRVGEEVVIVL